MQNVAAEFTIGQRPSINAEFSIEENQAIDTIFEINASPTKVSQLENDLDFQTGEEVERSIQEAIEPLEAEISTKVETIEGSALINALRVENTVTLTSKTFIFEQGIASNEWVITHNLNKRPNITLVDSSGRVFKAVEEYISDNQVIIRLEAATTGYAYLN